MMQCYSCYYDFTILGRCRLIPLHISGYFFGIRPMQIIVLFQLIFQYKHFIDIGRSYITMNNKYPLQIYSNQFYSEIVLLMHATVDMF